MAPLLLAIGMLPQVATSTSACMVLHLVLRPRAPPGTLAPEPATSAGLLRRLVSALAGRPSPSRSSRASRTLLLAFVLAASLFAALALLGVQMSSQPIDWAFGDLCA